MSAARYQKSWAFADMAGWDIPGSARERQLSGSRSAAAVGIEPGTGVAEASYLVDIGVCFRSAGWVGMVRRVADCSSVVVDVVAVGCAV